MIINIPKVCMSLLTAVISKLSTLFPNNIILCVYLCSLCLNQFVLKLQSTACVLCNVHITSSHYTSKWFRIGWEHSGLWFMMTMMWSSHWFPHHCSTTNTTYTTTVNRTTSTIPTVDQIRPSTLHGSSDIAEGGNIKRRSNDMSEAGYCRTVC